MAIHILVAVAKLKSAALAYGYGHGHGIYSRCYSRASFHSLLWFLFLLKLPFAVRKPASISGAAVSFRLFVFQLGRILFTSGDDRRLERLARLLQEHLALWRTEPATPSDLEILNQVATMTI